jgi:hypothetical protein
MFGFPCIFGGFLRCHQNLWPIVYLKGLFHPCLMILILLVFLKTYLSTLYYVKYKEWE